MNPDLVTRLVALYGEGAGRAAAARLEQILERFRDSLPAGPVGLDQRDAILITYPDQIQQEGEASLKSLKQFCTRHLSGVISGIHLLPFTPIHRMTASRCSITGRLPLAWAPGRMSVPLEPTFA